MTSLSNDVMSPPRKEVELCKAFITEWISRWACHNVKFNGQRLANAVGVHNDGISICKGAFITAAIELNYRAYPCWWSDTDAIFDMDFRKLENYWRENNIYVPV